MWMKLMPNKIRAKEKSGKESDEEQQTPACAETIGAEQHPLQGRRRSGWDRFIGGEIFGHFVQR
jgi:hypothetical protein